jgi:hypothetical protein
MPPPATPAPASLPVATGPHAATFACLAAAASATAADNPSSHPLAAAAAHNWHALVDLQHGPTRGAPASFPYLLDAAAALQVGFYFQTLCC